MRWWKNKGQTGAEALIEANQTHTHDEDLFERARKLALRARRANQLNCYQLAIERSVRKER